MGVHKILILRALKKGKNQSQNIQLSTFTAGLEELAAEQFDKVAIRKYALSDNLTETKAILDWEMATVGDPLMDLGTTIAYWAEVGDSDALKPFNLTWMAGNMTCSEMATYYAEKSQTNIGDIVFYYVFGSFKVAVICQQIYHPYKQGHTQDVRFASLIHVIKACAENARRAMNNLKI